MKKFLAFLGGTALAAAVIPYAYRKNEETDEKTIQALTWKASIKANPEDGGQKVSVTVGFNNPFHSAEADLFSDDLTVNYHTAPVCGCGCEGECETDCACEAVTDCCGECACENAGDAACCQEAGAVVDEIVEAVEEAAEETAGDVEKAAEDVTE